MKEPKCEEREQYDEDDYKEMLDCDGPVNVCGMQFDPSRILEELDPIAFRCGLNDFQEYYDVYICPECDEEYEEDEEGAKYCCQSDDDDDDDE